MEPNLKVVTIGKLQLRPLPVVTKTLLSVIKKLGVSSHYFSSLTPALESEQHRCLALRNSAYRRSN